VRIRRCRPLLASVVAVCASVGACYQQPEIPRDKPLACASDEPGECPAGFSCIANRICAPQACMLSEDCPEGLVCGRDGCGLPGADGGADGAVPLGLLDGGPLPVPLDASVPQVPDAAIPQPPNLRPDAPVAGDVGGGA
jgi:hypothetical protein